MCFKSIDESFRSQIMTIKRYHLQRRIISIQLRGKSWWGNATNEINDFRPIIEYGE